ncbi:MAG: hypothetical protein M3342_05745 [Bacteroidota bacterium]|nr:hypothetical protein [Chitinophagaceae bacterium]MBD0352188.1 hypothetical protein [Flavisolibacter sp.]MBD0365811.1 hypothetical protein [Flavisolibacter sp.]MDQ3843502.1 hypothetical protein [Bacteroidota bacterium]
MKTEIEKKIEELNKSKVPIVIIDPALEKDKDKVYFPEKLEKANEMLKTAKLPDFKHRS